MSSECCVYIKVPAPIVKRPRLLKHAGVDQGVRVGRGFSELEIKKAGLTTKIAEELGVPIDTRRRSCHEWNVKALQEFVEKVKPLIEARKTKPAKLIALTTSSAS